MFFQETERLLGSPSHQNRVQVIKEVKNMPVQNDVLLPPLNIERMPACDERLELALKFLKAAGEGVNTSALIGEFTDAEKAIGLMGSANCRFRNIPVGQADSEGAQTRPLICIRCQKNARPHTCLPSPRLAHCVDYLACVIKCSFRTS